MAAPADHKSSKSPSSSQSAHSSFNNSQGSRANRPTISVITTPPWARDEPPSPTIETAHDGHPRVSESRPSDVMSYGSSTIDLPGGASRWWTFNRQRLNPLLPTIDAGASPAPSGLPKPERRGLGLRERSMSWLPVSNKRASDGADRGGYFSREKPRDGEPGPSANGHPQGEHDWNVPLSTPGQPTNVPHALTPGWNVPWSPGLNELGLPGSLSRANSTQNNKSMPPWKRRRKAFRSFVLTSGKVPLLFRFCNITLTTAALALAIRIRAFERKNHVLGAIGSSPIIVIIFAPLTLLHVMAAIYLEYFGRPLGLWRTSTKLIHTLSEVLFVCAWSAALSLCFDNYSTSIIPCASERSTRWYNQLPRPPPLLNLGRHEGGVGDRICDDQVALISIVFFGLIMYCANLVISLFRIFEKVKYSQPTLSRS